MSNPDVKHILLEALDREGDERDRYLEAVGRADPGLRERVVALLGAHEAAGTFLNAPSGPPVAPSVSDDPGLAPGERIGRYRVGERVGEGGFGEVFEAEQLEPVKRRVAIKLLKPGMDSRQVIARFQAERQALAMMDHPSIATVLDAGRTGSGRPYFVMEFVAGEPITRYCDSRRLDLRKRLELFERVCMAVQHAHQKGIIHRDIKPSNVMVIEIDGLALPKVIDFGIAKAIGPGEAEATALTEARQLMGTPAYMSPEQVAASSGVDTRSDVYSLGVLLYELLAGAPPYDADRLRSASFGELERIICDEPAPKPSARLAGLGDRLTGALHARSTDLNRLRAALRGDLDWIVSRALEKEPDRRYPTANALALDVRRFLRNLPVEAGPPSASYRFRKFARRNRPQLVATVVAALSILLLAVGSVGFALREQSQSIKLQDELDRSKALYDRLQQEFETSRQLSMDLRSELARANALADFSQSIIASVDPAQARGQDTRLLEAILQRAGERVRVELAEHPEAAVGMLNTIGYTYLQIAKYDESEAMFREADALAAAHLEVANTYRIDARRNLAGAIAEQSRYEEAAEIFSSLVDDLAAALGDEHVETVGARANLGVLYQRMGDFERARETLQAALDERIAMLGEEHEDTISTMNNLATVLGQMGEDDEARRLLERVLDVQIRDDGEDHPRTLQTMNNVAGVHRRLGENERAEEMYRRVLDVKRRILPPEHPSTLITMNNLASLLVDDDRLDEAEPLYVEAVKIAQRTLGDRDMRTLALLNGLGRLYREQGRLEESLALATSAHATMVDIAGQEHPNSITLLNNVAALQADLGRLVEAEISCRKAIRVASDAMGPLSDQARVATRTLADLLAKDGRHSEAERLLLDLHQACLEKLGLDHAHTRRAAEAIVELYDGWGRSADAAEWRSRAGS